MGLFRKQSAQPQPTDEALSFFSTARANEFRALAREVFAEFGLEVTVHPDHAVDDSGRQFGFWNIAAQCADTRPREWRGLVREHVQAVLASLSAPDPFQSISSDDIARRTYARLYAEDGMPPLGDYPHREFVPGVVELLALDLPDSVAVFNHEHAGRFGGWEALRGHGVTNLRSLPVEELEVVDLPGGGRFTVLLGDSFYTASRALLLPGLATQLTGEDVSGLGWLMSIPSRHQLGWHVVRDSTVIAALDAMIRLTVSSYDDAPGSLSPHVYWWNGSEYEQLTHIGEDGAITVHPSPAFTEVLNVLAADQQD